MERELKRLDMEILQFLSDEPGTRNVRKNLSHELINQIEDDVPDPDSDPDAYLEEVEIFARRVSNRLTRGLLSRDLVRRVGPSEKSGLYELTDQGRRAAQILDQWDLTDSRDRLLARHDIDSEIVDVN